MGKIIGIDLGTTNSVVATVDGPQPRVLQNKDAKSQTPSVVSLRKRKGKSGDGKGEILIGDSALDNWVMAPVDTIISVKRLMGRGYSDPEVQKVKDNYPYEVAKPSYGTKDSVVVKIGGQEYSPIDVSAMILKKLKEDAEFRLNDEVTHAVITVPAYFSQIQRDTTRRAGIKAGLKIIKIVDEPTAAAVAFGMDSQDSSEPKTLLVYDLGGGTFDISVLMWSGNIFAPLNLEGDMWLGGDNFDQVIVDYAVNKINNEYSVNSRDNARFMAALRKAARATKERLSSSRSADLTIPAILQDKDGNLIDVDIEITREEFEHKVRHLVERSMSLVDKALKNAELTVDQVDFVLMAGNATCIPIVQKAMEEKFGQAKVVRKIQPKECVAIGASLLAVRFGGVVCQSPDPGNPQQECGMVNPLDATKCSKCGAVLEPGVEKTSEGVLGLAPFSYGTQSEGDKFNVFIKKNDPYPTQDVKTMTFYTQRPNQRIISIPVYGGDNMEKASANEKQGEAFAILPPGMPEGTVVRISVWLNDNGIFELSAHLEDGTDLEPTKLEGGKVQQVVETLQDLLPQLAAAKEKNPEDAKRIERQIEAVLGKIKGADDNDSTSGSIGDKELGILGEELGKAGNDMEEIEQKADNIVSFYQFVVQRFDWALDPNLVYEINKACAALNEAVKNRNAAAAEQRYTDLDKVINRLPDVVKILLGLRSCIEGRIRPMRPEEADSLSREVDELENAFKTRDPLAMRKMQVLAQKVNTAAGQAGPMLNSGIICPKCRSRNVAGSMKCDKCGWNLTLVRH